MDLYCFGESGHSYKVALALELSGIDWRPIKIDFFAGESRSDAYRSKINEMGEAPVLVDGDTRLSQSGVILDYLTEKTGHFAPDPQDRREVLRWVLWDNHKLSAQAGQLRFMMNFLAPEKRVPDVIDYLRGRTRSALKLLDAHLEGRDWIVGQAMSHADLSCCSYLYYPEPFDFDPSEWPNLARWRERIQTLPRWKSPYDLMPRAFG